MLQCEKASERECKARQLGSLWAKVRSAKRSVLIAKRLLGNARAVVAGAFIATVEPGAAKNSVLYASRVRSGVVELSRCYQ